VAVVKYDVSNVEAGGGGEQPQPALYSGHIVSITPRKEKANGDPVRDLEVIVSVGEGFAYQWTYIKTPDDPNYNETAHGWKLRELTDALKLPPKGSMDTEKQKNKPVNVKIVADTNLEGEYRGRIKNLFAPGKVEEDGEGMSDGGGDEEPLTAEELAEWSTDDLKEELQAIGVTLAGRFSKDKAIAAILENQEGAAEDEAEADAGSNGAGVLDPELMEQLRADADYYSEWSDDDIKEFVNELGISGNVTGRKTRAKYIEAIVSLAEAAGPWQDGNSDGSGDDGEPDDYDDWTAEELSDEIATRNEQDAEITITGRKTKDKMVAALREDDKAAQPF